MDILGSLLDRITSTNEEEDFDLTPEEIEAERKKERIQFHREHVRNGPRSFGRVTNGQLRRAETRSRRSQARKATKRYRRSWFVAQQRQATLRGQLILAGVLPTHAGDFLEPDPAIVAILAKEYGSVADAAVIWNQIETENTKQAKRAAAQRALQDWKV